MHFSDMIYERPDFDQLEIQVRQMLDDMTSSDSSDIQISIMHEMNRIRENVDTAMSIARIRQTIDTTDTFYDAESSFLDEHSPRYEALTNQYYHAFTNSRFRPELEKHFGKHLFALAEAAQKTFKPEIMEDLAE